MCKRAPSIARCARQLPVDMSCAFSCRPRSLHAHPALALGLPYTLARAPILGALLTLRSAPPCRPALAHQQVALCSALPRPAGQPSLTSKYLLEEALGSVLLALAVVMAGSGHLPTLKLLRGGWGWARTVPASGGGGGGARSGP